MHVAIVGAGIAGLATALTLLREGIDVTVLERTAALQGEGAGIQLASNGMKVLNRLGLEAPIAAVSSRPERVDYVDLESGRLLISRPLGDEALARYGAPAYQIHRGDLLDVLVGALPAGIIRTGARVVAVEQDDESATVRLESGEIIRADAVVGADGIHSTLREALFGRQDTRFANLLSWRALIPAERLGDAGLAANGSYAWAGPGRTVVAYWVRPGEVFNFVGTVPADEVRRESWSEAGDVSELRESFRGAEPRLLEIVRQVEAPFITGLYFRDPLEHWSAGRITLLGDAAHTMLPFLAQGGCQGIEDGQVLARCLARHGAGGIPAALTEYEQRRRPRTMRVQSAARAAVRQLHEPDPARIRARNGQWAGTAKLDPVSEATWGWLYRYDAVQEADVPLDQVQGMAAVFEGVRMQRPVAQEAFDLRLKAFTPEDTARGVDGLREGYDRFLSGNFPIAEDRVVTPLQADGLRGLWVDGERGGSRVVLHCHGGGYVIGSAHGSLEYAARLADAVGGRCLTLDYRLAPEHPFPAALEDARAAYAQLLDQGVAPGNILLSGGSSGGGLALALAVALRDAGQPLPAGIVAVSPFVDLTLSGPSIDLCAGRDPTATRDGLTVMAGSYFQEAEPTDPLVSPLLADLSGLPPLLLQAARNEGLASDTTRLAEKAAASGVDVETHLYDDSVHVFALYPFLPEAGQALERIAAFATRVTGAV